MLTSRRLCSPRRPFSFAGAPPLLAGPGDGGRELRMAVLVAAAAHLAVMAAPLSFLTACAVDRAEPARRQEVYVLKQVTFTPPANVQRIEPMERARRVLPDPMPMTDNLVLGVPSAPPMAKMVAAELAMVGGIASPGFPGLATETYGPLREAGFVPVADDPLSTFAVDVDTAAAAIVRRYLLAGALPPAAVVRLEEMVNALDYRDLVNPGPEAVAIELELADCPWRTGHLLARVAVVGRDVPEALRPPANLVFLVDVSGSMHGPDRLPLVRGALADLASRLHAGDSIALVVYAGATGVVLPPTPGSDQRRIQIAVNGLEAGGSTNGGAGLRLAYDLACEHFLPGGVNRVILATDGDFNVGVTDPGELVRLIRERAEAGIFLSVWGVGVGNLKDHRLEQVADQGNGDYAYLDSPDEATRVVDRLVAGGFQNVAKDVKIQVELNPAAVDAYRLLGYENRALADHEFRDDTVDGGEMSAGHRVTAIYELVPHGLGERLDEDGAGLRYQRPAELSEQSGSDELLHVGVRFKDPEGRVSRPVERSLRRADAAPMSPGFSLASSVGLFGMLLRGSVHAGEGTLDDAVELARRGASGCSERELDELLELMERSRPLLAARAGS